jgi:hypothetical protein
MADGLAGRQVEPERLIGERIAGRFVVERLIGSGELSTAFRAHDERLHRRVTVKVFHPRHRDDVQVVESQLAAARAVARLSHEHVAIVIDRGEHEGMPLVVLEYVRGENLQERMDRFAPLQVAEVAGYALQIARALTYAHGHGVVHGNLRPGNVLLTEDRDVKLVDFGGGSYVAQLVGDPYLAPELREVDPDAPAEPTDDVYALGALAVAALTEQAPRAGMDPSELLMLRPDVSPRLAATIARALSVDPEDRHLSMRELAAELAAARETAAAVPQRHDVDQPTRAWSVDEEARAHGLLDETADIDEATADEAPRSRPRPVRRRRAKRARTPHEVRARILAWSVVVLPLVALVIFGVMIAGERSSKQVETGDKPRTGTAVPVEIAGVTSFDPKPGGDGAEHEEEVAGAHDDDPQTAWQTEGYSLISFAQATKPGVGIVVQLADDVDVRDVQLFTSLPGWVAEVRLASTPQTALDGWREASKPTPIKDGTKIEVDSGGEPARFVLVWITQLAIDTEETDKARARINEVAVLGVPAKES